MYKQLFQAEFLKIRKKWIWFLVALGPIGVVGLQALNFLLRYETLSAQYGNNMWEALATFVLGFLPPVLMLGMAIITSLLANIEHENASWKQLLATPVRKRELFITKFVTGWALLFVSCLILLAAMLMLGFALGFGTGAPWELLLTVSFFPYFAAMPILALQIWLSIVYQNQGIALTLGVLFAVIIFISRDLPNWFPLSWPTLQTDVHPITNVSLGISLGLVIFAAGLIHFVRRDVYN